MPTDAEIEAGRKALADRRGCLLVNEDGCCMADVCSCGSLAERAIEAAEKVRSQRDDRPSEVIVREMRSEEWQHD